MFNNQYSNAMKRYILFNFLFLCLELMSQTTLEEWKYMTKGYYIQKESGLDMKKGYELNSLFTSYTTIQGCNRKFNFIELFRLSDNLVCGIIIEYEKIENGKKSIFYFAIPTKNSSNEIWKEAKKMNLNFSSKELGIAYSWALTELISNQYLNSGTQIDDKPIRKEQEAINKANMDGLFGRGNISGNTNQGNPTTKGNSGGNSWSLSGRSLSGRLVTPTYDKDVEGKITVNLVVDSNGDVIITSIGSPTNIADTSICNAALLAAKSTKFTNGSGEASGSITYNFKLN